MVLVHSTVQLRQILLNANCPDVPDVGQPEAVAAAIHDIVVQKDAVVHDTAYSSSCTECNSIVVIPENVGNGGVVSCIECGEHLRVSGMADEDLPVGGGGEVGVVTEAETVVEGD